MENIEIDIDEDTLFKLMLMAHEQDITLNKLVENILREELKKYEKKVSIQELENEETFDMVFDDVVNNGTIYTIYEDNEYTIPKAKIIQYESIQNTIE